MTDPQAQPGQTNPQTQGGGVFGGNPEEVFNDSSMFGPLEKVENTETAAPDDDQKTNQEVKSTPENNIPASSSPFDGYILPQDNQTTEETPAVEELTIETPVVEETAPVVEEAAPVVEEAAPVVEEVAPVVEEVAPVVEEAAPVVEEAAPVVEEVAPVVEEAAIEEPNTDKPLSDIQQKFTSLLDNVTELTSILRLKDGEILEIIGSNNDKLSVLYQFGLNDQNEIHVKRIETQKDDDETAFNELKLGLNPESNLFEIFLDDVLLFEESDLLEDHKKKSQVIEKINKLIFLTESKLKDTQKDLRAKQEEEDERRRLQDIFRNF